MLLLKYRQKCFALKNLALFLEIQNDDLAVKYNNICILCAGKLIFACQRSRRKESEDKVHPSNSGLFPRSIRHRNSAGQLLTYAIGPVSMKRALFFKNIIKTNTTELQNVPQSFPRKAGRDSLV